MSESRRKATARKPPARWLVALLAAAAAGAGLALAWHYPLVFPWPCLVFLLACAAFYLWPGVWLVALPAALPIVGFAPWTGWITFEELDMLVLAAAAGGYGRLAWRPPAVAERSRRGRGPRLITWVMVLLFAASTVVAMLRGFADAGGWQFGWFQGYREPMNSVRLAKSFFLALLLVPLWRAGQQAQPERSQEQLGQGLALGLATAALTTLWERAAFTGLLNFSSDYRTTGLFWEMHVGGAALDGFLALSLPFALRELLAARSPARWTGAAAVIAIGAYACLTTFSRGVYLSAAIAVPLFLVAWQRQQNAALPAPGGAPPAVSLGWVPGLVLAAIFGLSASWMFPSSGYRGMVALWGTTVLALPLAQVLRALPAPQWVAGLLLALVAAALAAAVSWLVPKGAYLTWTAAFAGTLAILVSIRLTARPVPGRSALALAGFVATAIATILVAHHWGEAPGLAHAAPVVAVVLVLALIAGASRRAVWPTGWRWQAACAASMGLVGAMVAVFGGGAYMGDRFSTGVQDLDGRLAHWQLSRDMLAPGTDWLLGKGMGRFPANFAMQQAAPEHAGDYRLQQQNGNNYLRLASSPGPDGWGEIFRVSQRIGPPGPAPLVSLRVRSDKKVSVHAEVCEKHLLYAERCATAGAETTASPGVWQDVRLPLKGENVGRGLWYAPRLLVFSIAVGSRNGLADVDDIALFDARGHQVLANGDFSGEMAHWFFSSDRVHMPWHAKSMLFNTLFDQGVVGAAILCVLLALALWRTLVGASRNHPLAPALAASLAGFFVVGLFDSLLDVPRLAWLFYLLLLVSLGLRGAAVPTEHMRRGSATGLALVALAVCTALQPQPTYARSDTVDQVLRVGPAREVRTLAEAARRVRPGTVVEVDAGLYEGDVAVWTQDRLTLRAVGGRVRLRAAGQAAEGKGIWVVRAHGMQVEGFDFEGARVPSRNGAGIRLERGSLRVRDCSFTDNEMGLLTSNDNAVELDVENSEFAHNQRPDGHNHNLYVGQIARLSVTGSYFHHARTGHLLKSRAAVSHILYNRLTDEAGGTASYELEFPNGGVAHVVGNLIAQTRQTENPHLVSFGAEGYTWARNELHLHNNTLVNPLDASGVFLRVAPGSVAVRAFNNLLVGVGQLDTAGPGEYQNNLTATPADFIPGAPDDYRLQPTSPLAGRYVDPRETVGLQPRQVYVHPRGTRALPPGARGPGAVPAL